MDTNRTTDTTTTEETRRRELLTKLTGEIADSTHTDLAYCALYITGIKYGDEHPDDEAAAWYLAQIDQIILDKGSVDTVKALTLDLAEHIAERQKNGKERFYKQQQSN